MLFKPGILNERGPSLRGVRSLLRHSLWWGSCALPWLRRSMRCTSHARSATSASSWAATFSAPSWWRRLHWNPCLSTLLLQSCQWPKAPQGRPLHLHHCSSNFRRERRADGRIRSAHLYTHGRGVRIICPRCNVQLGDVVAHILDGPHQLGAPRA